MKSFWVMAFRSLGAGMALLAAMVLGFPGPVQGKSQPGSRVQFSLMTYNVRFGLTPQGTKDLSAIARVIRSANPDLVLLQEIDLKDLEILAPRIGLWHYSGVPSYGTRSKGLGFLSRWPLTVRGISMPGAKGKRDFARAEVNLDGQLLSLINVHLSRTGMTAHKPLANLTMEMGAESPRLGQAAGILNHLHQNPGPFVIVAGDFNTFTNSRPYVLMHDTLAEVFDGQPPPNGTYRGSWLLCPKIDHIFHSPSLEVLEATVIQEGGSDHFPVLAVFALGPPWSLP